MAHETCSHLSVGCLAPWERAIYAGTLLLAAPSEGLML